MSDADEAWPAAWSRTALPTAILAVLRDSARHGYALATQLQARGFGRPRGGSLYPLLGRLEDEGLIESTWEPGGSGPGRRAYSLTGKGRQRLEWELGRWAALTAALGAETRTVVHRGGPGTGEHHDSPVGGGHGTTDAATTQEGP